MRGLPSEVFDALARLMAWVCDDPYDRVVSAQVGSGRRMAELGDSGFITFGIDEDAKVIRVYDLVWTG